MIGIRSNKSTITIIIIKIKKNDIKLYLSTTYERHEEFFDKPVKLAFLDFLKLSLS